MPFVFLLIVYIIYTAFVKKHTRLYTIIRNIKDWNRKEKVYEYCRNT